MLPEDDEQPSLEIEHSTNQKIWCMTQTVSPTQYYPFSPAIELQRTGLTARIDLYASYKSVESSRQVICAIWSSRADKSIARQVVPCTLAFPAPKLRRTVRPFALLAAEKARQFRAISKFGNTLQHFSGEQHLRQQHYLRVSRCLFSTSYCNTTHLLHPQSIKKNCRTSWRKALFVKISSLFVPYSEFVLPEIE